MASGIWFFIDVHLRCVDMVWNNLYLISIPIHISRWIPRTTSGGITITIYIRPPSNQYSFSGHHLSQTTSQYTNTMMTRINWESNQSELNVNLVPSMRSVSPFVSTAHCQFLHYSIRIASPCVCFYEDTHCMVKKFSSKSHMHGPHIKCLMVYLPSSLMI